MSAYSNNVENWLNQIVENIGTILKSYDEMTSEEKSEYKSVYDLIVWTPEDQALYGAVGPIELEVGQNWVVLKPKEKKEMGGSKEAAVNVIATRCKERFDMDFVEMVRKNGLPQYKIQGVIDNIEWDDEEDNNFKTVKKLSKHEDLDRGSALHLFWSLSPEYYTQFSTEKTIDQKERKTAFKLIKFLEMRLIEDSFKTNSIYYKPEPVGDTKEQQWTIDSRLYQENIP